MIKQTADFLNNYSNKRTAIVFLLVMNSLFINNSLILITVRNQLPYQNISDLRQYPLPHLHGSE